MGEMEKRDVLVLISMGIIFVLYVIEALSLPDDKINSDDLE
jgi:hypothetical protein